MYESNKINLVHSHKDVINLNFIVGETENTG